MDSNGVIHSIENTGFTLISIVGIKDILREEVPDAVAICYRFKIIAVDFNKGTFNED